MPPEDYLPRVREICTRSNVLMIADEIQSGLARTGYTFACDRWGVVPDVYLLGKALGGGVVPLSAVVADADILGVLHPGEHSSTLAATRWQPRSARPWCRCSRRGNSSPAQPNSVAICTPACKASSVTACWRSAGSACGPGSTSTRRWAPESS